MDKIYVSFYLLWGAGGVWVCCDTVSLDLWCGFVEIFRSHFTCQRVNITDKTKSVSFKHFLKTSDLTYTCQLSRLRHESHACGLKTSISRRLTPAGQFLAPDWKMWVVAVLLDTIFKNMLTQTHVRKKTMCKMNKWQYLPRDLWFLKWKALGASSPLADFGRLRTSSEDFGLLWESSEMIESSSKIPALPG